MAGGVVEAVIEFRMLSSFLNLHLVDNIYSILVGSLWHKEIIILNKVVDGKKSDTK